MNISGTRESEIENAETYTAELEMDEIEAEELEMRDLETGRKMGRGLQRVLAIIGIVFLLGLYLATFVLAFFTNAETKGLFMACLFSTVAIPIMIYGYILVYRLVKDQNGK